MMGGAARCSSHNSVDRAWNTQFGDPVVCSTFRQEPRGKRNRLDCVTTQEKHHQVACRPRPCQAGRLIRSHPFVRENVDDHVPLSTYPKATAQLRFAQGVPPYQRARKRANDTTRTLMKQSGSTSVRMDGRSSLVLPPILETAHGGGTSADQPLPQPQVSTYKPLHVRVHWSYLGPPDGVLWLLLIPPLAVFPFVLFSFLFPFFFFFFVLSPRRNKRSTFWNRTYHRPRSRGGPYRPAVGGCLRTLPRPGQAGSLGLPSRRP
ncbi:hypothetical protein VTK73DRAFT_3131 [Phialemonium thermophilum]|uniref:Uncharacterized protein n=1 Tax=Phialemonium thermophilum TaxID=223376 RepID=A0ABR3VKF8_9PEZI